MKMVGSRVGEIYGCEEKMGKNFLGKFITLKNPFRNLMTGEDTKKPKHKQFPILVTIMEQENKKSYLLTNYTVVKIANTRQKSTFFVFEAEAI